MTVFCVVVSFNGEDLTRRAVDALKAQTEPTDFVVWDNASTDGTRRWLESDPSIPSHLSDENLLWTPAVNAAINKYATNEHDLYVWMNNDAAPTPRCFERLAAHLRGSNSAGTCIGLIAPVMERIGGQQDVASNPDVHDRRNEPDQDAALVGLGLKRVSYVLGACAMMPRHVWEIVGPLDETMPLGADDFALSLETVRAGYQIMVAKDAYCAHAGHASSRSKEGQAKWAEWNGKSWDRWNEYYAGYYHTELEAIRCMWDGRYFPMYEAGTGWLDEDERNWIQKRRDDYERSNPNEFHGEARF